jgi:hypothetical protein
MKTRAPKELESRKLCRAARFYRLLLFFYPTRFRQKFGAEMLRLFKDQWHDVQPSKSTLRRLRFWLWLCADTGWSAGREHLIHYFVNTLTYLKWHLSASCGNVMAHAKVPYNAKKKPILYSSYSR